MSLTPPVAVSSAGYNVCIFAYGQTGSGKTHTMSGTDVSNLEGRGINYRALDNLFMIADKRSQEWEYSISVQMLEIYNEQLRDLLLDKQGSKKASKLDIRMCEQSGRNVPDAIQVPFDTRITGGGCSLGGCCCFLGREAFVGFR